MKNVHDLLAKLAWDFSPEQLDHLFDCFKVSGLLCKTLKLTVNVCGSPCTCVYSSSDTHTRCNSVCVCSGQLDERE